MPAPANPYAGRALFVGRQDELAEVSDYLSQGESALLIGGRRTGKTSLAERIQNVGRPLIYLDAGAWKLNSEASVLHQFGLAFGVVACETRTAFTELLRHHAPLALVIDEADRILSARWAGGFLSYLRFLIDKELRNDLSILLLGGPVLHRYRNPDDQGSPALNVARRVYLQPLKREARKEMAAPLPVAPDFAWLNRHAGGHPWLLKRLMEQLWKGRSADDALDRVFEDALQNFETWNRQLGDDGRSFLRALPPEGIPRDSLSRDAVWRKHRAAAVIARSLCLVDFDEQGRIVPGPELFSDFLGQAPADEWDLAISYASEDVDIARQIAHELRGDIRVFFAPDQSPYLWGQDLNSLLPNIYGVRATAVLVLSSHSYVTKHWTLAEWQVARTGTAELLLINLGELPPDIPVGLVYRPAKPESFISLISDLRKKLSHQRVSV